MKKIIIQMTTTITIIHYLYQLNQFDDVSETLILFGTYYLLYDNINVGLTYCTVVFVDGRVTIHYNNIVPLQYL